MPNILCRCAAYAAPHNWASGNCTGQHRVNRAWEFDSRCFYCHWRVKDWGREGQFYCIVDKPTHCPIAADPFFQPD